MRQQDKFRACLLGGALGDALGYPIADMTGEEINHQFGPEGLSKLLVDPTMQKAPISATTQLTLFTATALLQGQTRLATRGARSPYTYYLWQAYKEWLYSQVGQFPVPGDHNNSWMLNLVDLFQVRSPEATCVQALEQAQAGSIDQPFNDSQAEGGVIRVAPIGLFFIDRELSPKEVADLAGQAAALTHGHPLAYLPAAFHAYLINTVASLDLYLEEAVLQAKVVIADLYGDESQLDLLFQKIDQAMDLSDYHMNDQEALDQIGQAKTGDIALASAIYCALKYQTDFKQALVTAANFTAAKSATAALTGQILGAKFGMPVLAQEWLDQVELSPIIEEVADDLYYGCQFGEDDVVRAYWGAHHLDNQVQAQLNSNFQSLVQHFQESYPPGQVPDQIVRDWVDKYVNGKYLPQERKSQS